MSVVMFCFSVQKWADLRLAEFGCMFCFCFCFGLSSFLGRGLVKKFCFFLCTYHDFALTLDDNFSFLLCCFAFVIFVFWWLTLQIRAILWLFFFFFFLRVLKYIYRKSSDLQTYYKYFHYIFYTISSTAVFWLWLVECVRTVVAFFCWLLLLFFSSANF